MNIRDAVSDLLDLLYPPSLYCICCGKIIDSSRPYRLCNECMDSIHWAVSHVCSKCGKPLSDLDPMDTCYSCREQEHVYRRGYTCAGYGACERAIIFALKYSGRTDIAPTLGEIMYDRMQLLTNTGEADLYAYDMIIPVPLHSSRQQKRGFNQAELIAAELSKLCGVPLAASAVIRSRETDAMKTLSPGERSLNIAGAFEVKEVVRDKAVLCVDDIYTTGSTADEVARALLSAGASRVDFLSFAAGADRIKS